MNSGASALAPLLDGSTAGELIPGLVRHGLQQLIELEVAAVLGADRHERSEERVGYRNGYRPCLLTTQVGDINLEIPKLRNGSFLPGPGDAGLLQGRGGGHGRQRRWPRRELLDLKVGDSESEAFWSEFIGLLNERGLTGAKFVISDAQKGLTKAIRRMLQGSCWERCRVHFARNLLQRVPKAHQGMVTAALRSVFAKEKASEIEARWDDLASSLAESFPGPQCS
jgi:transposase-like protein